MNKIAAIVGILGLLASGCGKSDSGSTVTTSSTSATQSKSSTTPPAEAPMKVDLKEVLILYSSGNEVAADQKYKGKLIELTGHSLKITTTAIGSAVFEMEGNIHCHFSKDA